uniref:RRM domain-containing protein n=1 Tax=Aureoumbra lagunensis TaxID=44058 RepID=A0A7S3JN42_9STRA|mmetsp:Transcript_22768/g.29483  ORF Transcript_22768/g.29483 Transcript_22768/m.29483 type:complete len:369 (-) Transcript_22768:510-1616(-)|eukprot:CAMPEP_0197295650 /NCGR_PEP_ID=MMETSP0890-20130614/36144_1 /TAXON_ID=44058 ORGANISM="Aureoumbra lagunensis, Strain CCMP1510" /NCGR_SAMPLE_ID=MMETSP0890 /ASSEMBLY_ACC=CAM_ASM_000533 /LENGTH=368 /DNA_ID=CAMNT_0042771747 /DNA_START=23 /DNA_END=1129 /DNA_ORIENTATION=-
MEQEESSGLEREEAKVKNGTEEAEEEDANEKEPPVKKLKVANDDQEEAASPTAKKNTEEDDDQVRNDEILRLAGIEFASREALWSWVQELTSKLEPGGKATGVDQFVLFALLEAHPTSEEKMNGGVVHIGYDINADFPDTKSYYVERKDGSRVGFSIRKCVEEIFPQGIPLILNGHAKRFKNNASGKHAMYDDKSNAFPPGSAISISGLEGQGINHHMLRKVMGKFGIVRWMELSEDEGIAKLRFDSVESADNAIANFTDIEGCAAKLNKMSQAEEDELRSQWIAARAERNNSPRGGQQHYSNDVPGKYGPASLCGKGGRGVSRGRPLDQGRVALLGGRGTRSGGSRGRQIQSPRGLGGGRAGRSLLK